MLMPKPLKTVLVTGGAGYIGSHIVLSLLKSGYHPVVLDDLSNGSSEALLPGVPFYKAAVGDSVAVSALIKEHAPESIIHCAGSIIVSESFQNPLLYYQNNTEESLSFLRTAYHAGIRRFLFSSTAAVYGHPASIPIPETALTQPISPYGRSKLVLEWALQDLALADPTLRYGCLRYFNVAGADPDMRLGQRGNISTHLIKMAAEAACGKRKSLSIYGTDYQTPDGTCVRDYVHVSDLAGAHVQLLTYLRAGGDSQTLNVGYSHGFSVREIIEVMQSLRPFTVEEAPRRRGDPDCLVADATRLRNLLAWKPLYDDIKTICQHALLWEETL
jgi:UDP-glucose 4-epimerase